MNKNERLLAEERIPRLLYLQSMPAVIGLLLLALYNFVDAVFVGQGVGALGLAGLAIAFPVQMMMIAVAQMVGVGAASIIARALGAKKYASAERALGNFFSLTIFVSILITIIGLVFFNPIMQIFGATPTTLPYAREYMGIQFLDTIFLVFAAGATEIIRAEGNAKFAMIVMGIAAAVNLILDPIFIFVLDMGLMGASLATAISHVLAAIASFAYFVLGKSGVAIHFHNLKLKLHTVKEILAIGFSSFVRQVATTAMAAILNNSLAVYGGDLAVATFGIIFRIMSMASMPMFGLVQGILPVLGYNFGAKKYLRSRKAIIYSSVAASVFALFAALTIIIFAEPIIRLFTSDADLIEITKRSLRIIMMLFPLIGFQVVAGGVYQALGKAWTAFILSLLRQVIFLIPFVVFLPFFFGLDGVWFSFPAADLSSAIITMVIILREVHLLKKLHLSKQL